MVFLHFIACNNSSEGLLVKSVEEFDNAVSIVKPGDHIVLANGIWNDTELVFKGEGSEEKPIRLVAQTKGNVFLEGQSNLKLSGKYLHVEGLVFRNGHTPTSEVISFKTSNTELAYHSRVTECVIDDYNPSERFESDYWVGIYGKHNRLDHCYLIGKRNQGVTVAVRMDSEESRENHHRIDHNYFGYNPVLGSNGGETLRIGTSHYSLFNSFTLVEDNYFEHCNGEHEIISNKSCNSTFRNNTFYECQGTLTMRHGNETMVDNNYFFGNGKANTGGIRIINEKQIVKNNYCEGLTGYRFRGALVIMNGVPNSALNRYFQVVDSEASNNMIVNSDYIQLCAGSDEERSAVPANSRIKNNIIVNENRDDVFTIYDDISGIAFSGNILSENIKLPEGQPKTFYEGFKKEKINLSRNAGILSAIGYAEVGPKNISNRPTQDNTGVEWYPRKDYTITFCTGKIIEVGPGENTILEAVKTSKPGDIIQLGESGIYHASKSIDLKHTLTIKANPSLLEKPMITFERSSLFNIENGGSLFLEGLNISGKACDDKPGNTVIRTSRYSMINNYKLKVKDCRFADLNINHSFDFLKIYKNTFADSIELVNSEFYNITGNILALDKETDDIGIYNVENVLVDKCLFKNIGGVAIHLYRGGGDESTFGPILNFTNSALENVGHDSHNRYESAISLYGVQLADIREINVKDSEKFNLHLIVGDPVINISNSQLINSGSIVSNNPGYNLHNVEVINRMK